MNENLKPNRPGTPMRRSITSLHGNISGQIGNIRNVILENRVINKNGIPYAADTIRESIEETFGK